MDILFALLSFETYLLAFVIALGAGVIKGMVGFAMPMILISGLSSVISPELALAGLMLPTLATNGWQALRQGRAAAWQSMKRFRVFMLVGGTAIVLSAQLVRLVDPDTLLLLIAVPVTGFALIQLAGAQLRLPTNGRGLVEALIALLAGAIGGVSGVWGPPTVMYLTALETPKSEQLRIQGVIYGLGALVLFLAHIKSGVVRADTVVFSASLLVPALLGTWVGFQLHERIDQAAFKKVTLVVLLIAALNLMRRALLG
ncbi:sulfite exporter TauE/SafE family protein [Thalassobius sp. Cn5-15]|uniref:sulfite exporter TauE/SafE family protein n=1 Tax=Thalassobius sp. Cn5-15 TaxID=2917763 RepID=UPI001EF2158E|nr:sulfite exporter TauE/SafE family protein [Thalassobius sp. Cn5-15]MCG7493777.1 sulfite exporter TauE/SafE family protein [Thalassobius sp. Cn5-15]